MAQREEGRAGSFFKINVLKETNLARPFPFILSIETLNSVDLGPAFVLGLKSPKSPGDSANIFFSMVC